ncbi:MAG: helicase DnaB [Cyanobium sp. MED843]|nr:helicase DnaB [Cyanobium sp. MED843]
MGELLNKTVVLAVVTAMALLLPSPAPTMGPRTALSPETDNQGSTGLNLLAEEEARLDPTDFTTEELQLLQRRFGVHGPQTRLAQLFTKGVDQLEPLRSNTLERLRQLKPVIMRESSHHRVNPMLVTAILFDEIQHSKPGEDLPFIAHSGLVKTHGPAQLAISELIHQNRLPVEPSPQEMAWAREQLLDPVVSVELLVGKMKRLKQELGLPMGMPLNASNSYAEAKAIATLAYLHNGKLDYPARVLSYMQDPELHGLIYSSKRSQPYMLI